MTALHPATDTVRIGQTVAPGPRVRTASASGLVVRGIRALLAAPRRDTRPDVRDRREALGAHVTYAGADRRLRVF